MPKNCWFQLYPQWKQLEIKDTSLTVTSIHFKHSKSKPLNLTIKGTTSRQDCRLQIMRAYLTVRGATTGTLFLYWLSVPVTRAKFNEQLRGSLQFYHFCPKQFKSHSFHIGAATTAAAQGMSDSQIRSLGRRSSDAFMKYIRCSQRVPSPSRALAGLIARSSEREVRVGPIEKSQNMFAKPYMLECLAAVIFICSRFENVSLPPSVCMLQVSRVLRPGPCLTRTNRAGATTGTTSPPSCLCLLVSGIHGLGCSSAI